MGGIEQYVPAWLLAIAGTAVTMTAVAAAARKPPIKWVGRWLAWIWRRLAGDPLTAWGRKQLQHEVAPMVDRALDPVNEKLTHLHDCIEEVKDATGEMRTSISQAKAVAEDAADGLTLYQAETDRRLDVQDALLGRIEQGVRAGLMDRGIAEVPVDGV